MDQEINYFQFEASLDGVSYLADGGVSLRFATKELNTEERVKVSYFHRQYGWVCFKANKFTEDEIPKAEAEEGEKSPSQRLRAALYVLWKQRGSKGDFEVFRRRSMEDAINRVKACIEAEKH